MAPRSVGRYKHFRGDESVPAGILTAHSIPATDFPRCQFDSKSTKLNAHDIVSSYDDAQRAARYLIPSADIAQVLRFLRRRGVGSASFRSFVDCCKLDSVPPVRSWDSLATCSKKVLSTPAVRSCCIRSSTSVPRPVTSFCFAAAALKVGGVRIEVLRFFRCFATAHSPARFRRLRHEESTLLITQHHGVPASFAPVVSLLRTG